MGTVLGENGLEKWRPREEKDANPYMASKGEKWSEGVKAECLQLKKMLIGFFFSLYFITKQLPVVLPPKW